MCDGCPAGAVSTVAGLREDWRVAVGVVSGGHLFSHFYLLAFPPLFPFIGSEFGLSNAELGLVVSFVNLTGLLQTPVGSVVDRAGARRVFLLGVVVSAGGTALASLATGYLALLALAALAGLGQPAFHPANYAMMDAVTGDATKGKAYGLHQVAGWCGFAAAPLVVGTVGATAGWRVALVVAGTAGLGYAALSALLLRPHYLRTIDGADRSGGDRDADLATRLRAATRDLLSPAILTLFGFFLVMIAALQGVQSFVPILATQGLGLSPTLGNAALTALPAGAAVGVVLGGFLADRVPARAVIATGLALATATLWVGVAGPVPVVDAGFVAVFAVVGFFVGAVNPARDRLVSEYTPPGATGRTFGFVFTGLTVGAVVGPPAFGAVIDATAPGTGFLLMGGTFLAAGVVSLAFGTRLLPAPGAEIAE